MRLFLRRNTFGLLVIATTSAVYFASGMAFGRSYLKQSATTPLVFLFGLAAALLVNGALWGLFSLLRRIGKAQTANPPEYTNR